MPSGLKRLQKAQSLRFITFSCFHRLPLLEAPCAKETVETVLEQTRARHQAKVYAYDGSGRRTAKVGQKLYWYGSGGEILAETDTSGNVQNEYVYFGGKRVAMLPAGGSALYYSEDMLGSSRVIVTNTGAVCYDADFYPFGGERPITSTCQQNYKFEGKERDTETQDDNFGAREYSWRAGRWLSADWSTVPAPVPYANLTNPQTLNLYSMVADDPETFADLDGHIEGTTPGTANPTAAAAEKTQADTKSADAVAAQAQTITSNDVKAQQQTPDNVTAMGRGRGGHGQKERKHSGNRHGSGNANKHTRPAPGQPGFIEVLDPQTGIWGRPQADPAAKPPVPQPEIVKPKGKKTIAEEFNDARDAFADWAIDQLKGMENELNKMPGGSNYHPSTTPLGPAGTTPWWETQ